MAFHDLLTGGMKFAYKLVEGEPVHRSATFLLRRDELVEDLTEVRLFALHRRRGSFEQLLWHVLDLCIRFGVIQPCVVVENRIRPSRRVVRRGREVLLAVPNGCGSLVT